MDGPGLFDEFYVGFGADSDGHQHRICGNRRSVAHLEPDGFVIRSGRLW